MLHVMPIWLLIISKVLSAGNNEVFLISTKGCTIPSFPLYSENINAFVKSPQINTTCAKNNRIVDSNNTHIWIIEDALNLMNIAYRQEFYCCYKSFSSKGNMENISYAECIEFTTILEVKDVFVRVDCFYFDDKIYDDFFVFPENENVNNSTEAQVNDAQYNILILGIESMSRMNFHRTMSKTADYLQLNGAIELLGYNKLGDNSFPNLFPLLFGKSFKDVRATCFQGNPFDNYTCSFIWDKYREKGYYTALGSDSIAGFLGKYEYNLTEAPTHYYLQPFLFETRHTYQNPYYNYHRCLGSRYIYKIFLNYIEGLIAKLGYNKLFGTFWEESISHEDLNYPHVMDEDYVNLLLKLGEIGFLNRTVVIFLSDHGMRWGDIVFTEQGRLEERLPLFLALFPESFKRHFKEAFKNFKENSLRLTTPYDINETLKDLADPISLEDARINERSKSTKMNATSLFLPIPDTRTCTSVGIAEHWCSCYKGKKLRTSNVIRRIAAERLIEHINTLLTPYPECHQLRIRDILQVKMVQRATDRIYTVVLETSPGGAVLDGTLIREHGHWIVSGTVSRRNLYQKHSCIDSDIAKMYCFCK